MSKTFVVDLSMLNVCVLLAGIYTLILLLVTLKTR